MHNCNGYSWREFSDLEGQEVSGGRKGYFMKNIMTLNLFIPSRHYLSLLKICLLRFVYAEFVLSTKLGNEWKIIDVWACGSYTREKCDTFSLSLYIYIYSRKRATVILGTNILQYFNYKTLNESFLWARQLSRELYHTRSHFSREFIVCNLFWVGRQVLNP